MFAIHYGKDYYDITKRTHENAFIPANSSGEFSNYIVRWAFKLRINTTKVENILSGIEKEIVEE